MTVHSFNFLPGGLRFNKSRTFFSQQRLPGAASFQLPNNTRVLETGQRVAAGPGAKVVAVELGRYRMGTSLLFVFYGDHPNRRSPGPLGLHAEVIHHG